MENVNKYFGLNLTNKFEFICETQRTIERLFCELFNSSTMSDLFCEIVDALVDEEFEGSCDAFLVGRHIFFI